jgi:predicted  nucleic acid-binding Zn-ribbon protein
MADTLGTQPSTPAMSPQDISAQIEGDPGVQGLEAEQQEAVREREAANAKLTADSAAFDPEGAVGKQPEFQGNIPQDHFKDVMAQAPALMALAAVGGLFGRAHGVAMLQTTNAMMKGMVQGSADAYSAAREKYDQQVQEFKEKKQTWVEVYKAYSAAYKGRIDADLRAQQGANAAVGIIGKQTEMSKKSIGDMIKLSDKIEQTNSNISRHNSQNVTDAIRARADAERAATGAKRAETAAAASGNKVDDKKHEQAQTQQLVLQQIGELKDLVKNNSNVTGLGGAARRGYEWLDSSVDSSAPLPATQFKSKMESMMTNAYRLLKQQGGRMGADERRKLDDAIEGIKMTSGKQQLVKLDELQETLTGIATKPQGQGNLPVLTPDEAKGYPKGTKFIGSDGQPRTVQ